MRFTVLSKDGCTVCEETVRYLKDMNLEFVVLKVDREQLHTMCGKRVSTYPQILVDDTYIGTNFDLEAYIEDNYESESFQSGLECVGKVGRRKGSKKTDKLATLLQTTRMSVIDTI